MSPGEVVEKLCIANIKLFMLCDKKDAIVKNPGNYPKGELVKVMKQDVALCKERAHLKNQINKLFGNDIQEIKNYGDE